MEIFMFFKKVLKSFRRVLKLKKFKKLKKLGLGVSG
jgi:hypothetical protein